MSDSRRQQSPDSQQAVAHAPEGESTEADRRYARRLALATAAANLAILAVGGLVPELLYWSLCGVGIVSFIGILVLVNATSKDPNFEKGEMRKAITGGFFLFYFVVMGLFVASGFGEQSNAQIQTVIEQLMTPLSYLAGAIGAYYFGSRSFEKFLGARNKSE